MESITLIGGEDFYSAEIKLAKIKQDYLAKHKGEIKTYYADEIETITQIPELSGSIGMFAAEGLVIVRNLLATGKVQLKDQILELIKSKNLAQSVQLILFENCKFDKRSKIYKYMHDHKLCQDYIEPKVNEKEDKIKQFLWEKKWEIDANVRRILMERLSGQPMAVIFSELSKLELFLEAEEKSTLTELDLDLVNRETEQEIWEIFSLAHTDKKRAFTLLDNLLQQQIHYTQIIGFLALELRKIIEYHFAPEKMNPYIRSKVRFNADKFQGRKLQIALDKLFSLDLKLKTTNLDPRRGLILYLSIL
jgi:DNA polymerase III delta subunit